MKRIVDFFQKSGVQYFSTVGLDGKPKVRPFQFMLEDGGKLYYCTSNKKKVFGEISKNRSVEICAMVGSNSWLRLSGTVVFSEDLKLKTRIQETSPLVKSLYKTPDNPAFEIFYLSGAKGTISDFSGNPPEEFEL